MSNMFIIGAGFTKAYFPCAPLNDELLNKIIGQVPDESILGRIWSHYKIKNIEELLTKFEVDLEGGHAKFTVEDRYGVSSQLASYVRKFRFRDDINEAETLQKFCKVFSKDDVIISLNYDCLLEGALDYHKVWSPRGGYHTIGNFLDGSLPENELNIRILKIHGSENFRASSASEEINYEINAGVFLRSGKYSVIGGGLDSRPYVIAPSYKKCFLPDLESLLKEAIRFAHYAKNLVIIGCGLREEDSHLVDIITSFQRTVLKVKKSIIIVDPRASSIGTKLKRSPTMVCHRRWPIFTIELSSADERAVISLKEMLRG